jgi:hypothetical protein
MTTLAASVCSAVGAGCGGRATVAPFSTSAGFDDATVFGGTIPASEAGPIDGPLPPATEQASMDAGGLDPGSLAGDDAPDPMPPPGPPFDAGPDGVCATPLAAGDLAIDELMIESVSGAGDHGEWLEVTSTRECALNLRGLHGECPRGAKAATFDVTVDFWIPALGTFVVADSVSSAINHDLPQPVVAWRGNLGDVLRNKGGTVTLRANDLVVDTVTFPALALTVGASVAFPFDCDPATRLDFSRWETSVSSWFPGFRGTPNAPNTDISCPPSGDQ